MNIMITGGAGYIGQHVAIAMAEAGHSVRILDNNRHSLRIMHNRFEGQFPFSYEFYSICDSASGLSNIMNAHDIECVIHLAAKADARKAEIQADEYYRTNVSGTLNVVRAAKSAGVNRLIFASTCAVYGDSPPSRPSAVNMPPRPEGVYARTKVMGEQIIRDILGGDDAGCRYAILRFFNVAGADPDLRTGPTIGDEHLVSRAVRTAMCGGILPIYGASYGGHDGTCVRDYVHVADVATAHLAAIDRMDNQIRGNKFVANVGSGTSYSVLGVVQVVNDIVAPLRSEMKPAQSGDTSRLVAEINQGFDWRPGRSDLAVIVQDTHNWYKKS